MAIVLRRTIYSVFKVPERAIEIYDDLVSHGAYSSDLLIISKYSYMDFAFNSEARMMSLTRPFRLKLPVFLTNIPRLDPIGDKKGTVWILERMRRPGDLAPCLKELGFDKDVSEAMEASVLDGSVILMARFRSGSMSIENITQFISAEEGALVSTERTNPYLI